MGGKAFAPDGAIPFDICIDYPGVNMKTKKSPLIYIIAVLITLIVCSAIGLSLIMNRGKVLATEVSANLDQPVQEGPLALTASENVLSEVPLQLHTPFEFQEVPGVSLKTYAESDGIYSIMVYYPQTESMPVNLELVDFVEKEVKAFKNRFPGGVLDVRFKSYQHNQYLISFVFEVYKSHGDGDEVLEFDVKTFSYDLMGGMRLELRDIFAAGYEFIDLISNKAVESAEKYGILDKYGRENAASVLVADYDNFQSFAFDTEFLYFFFNLDRSVPNSVFTMVMPVFEFGDNWAVEEYFNDYFQHVEDSYNELGETEIAMELPDDFYYPVDAANPPETQDEIGGIIDIEFAKEISSALDNKNYVAITFDDGPHMQLTPKLLDILEETGAKATFFLLGHRVPPMKDIVKRMYEQGHSVASHTYNHKILTSLSQSQINSQLDQTNEIIEEIIGRPVTLLRPPYGAKNDMVAQACKERGMSIINWDIDPRDWDYFNAEGIAKHIIDRAENGSIILLHDLYPTSVEAAEIVIKQLMEDNFVFVTVEELLDMTTGLEAGSVYRNGKGPVK